MERKTLKIKANTDNVVTFLYDTPIEGTNNYGMYHLYAFDINGEEHGLFATDALHAKLMNFTTGDRVNIRKEEYEPNKFAFNVIPEEGTPARNTGTPNGVDGSYKSTPSATTTETREYQAKQNDSRTKDIHHQVAFKEACKMFGEFTGFLTEEELEIISTNTKRLLDVLEERDNLPF